MNPTDPKPEDHANQNAGGDCPSATCSRWVPRRYDPIAYHNNGGGWSWDADAIRECEDGDFVKYEDFEEARTLADEALHTLRITRDKYGLGDRHVMREKTREITRLREAIAAAEPHMRHGLNCNARIMGSAVPMACTCGMESAWKAVREILSENADVEPPRERKANGTH